MTLIQPNPGYQRTIINHFKKLFIGREDVQVVVTRRMEEHLRIVYRKDDIQEFLNSIHPSVLTSTEKVFTKGYATYILTITEGFGNVPKNSSIYVVNTVSQKGGILVRQDLTPIFFDVIRQEITATQYRALLNRKISEMTEDPIQGFLKELVKTVGLNQTTFTSKYIEAISSDDFQVIGNNFSELLSAWWTIKKYPESKAIKFPISSNYPLVDFINFMVVDLSTKRVELKYSVKNKGGAAPSIKGLEDYIKNVTYTDQTLTGIVKMLKDMIHLDVLNGIMYASRILNTPGYIWLKTKLKLTDDDKSSITKIRKFLDKFKDSEKLKLKLKPFYDVMNKRVLDHQIEQILSTKSDRIGLIMSPLGYHLVDKLNSNPHVNAVLTDAVRWMEIRQISVYMNVSQKQVSLRFDERLLSNPDNHFQFAWKGSAKSPTSHKISFKLVQ